MQHKLLDPSFPQADETALQLFTAFINLHMVQIINHWKLNKKCLKSAVLGGEAKTGLPTPPKTTTTTIKNT